MESDLLKTERIQRGWSQAKVAKALGVDVKTVNRWEQGQVIPYPYYRERLCTLFGKTAQQLGLLSDTDEDNALNEIVLLGVRFSMPGLLVQTVCPSVDHSSA